VRHVRHRLADGAQRRAEHRHPVVIVEAQHRDLARHREPVRRHGLERAERQDVVEREHRRGPRAAAKPAVNGAGDRLDGEARLDHLGNRSLDLGHRGQGAVDAPAHVAEPARGGDQEQTAVTELQEAACSRLGGAGIVDPDRVDGRAVVERAVDHDERHALPLQEAARGKAAVARHDDHACGPPGDQCCDLALLLAGVAAAGRYQKPPAGGARLALEPVDQLGEERVGELGHDRTHDVALGAAQGGGQHVAPVAQRVHGREHAARHFRRHVAPAGEHVRYGRRRHGGRSGDIADGQPSPAAAGAPAGLWPSGHVCPL
jgi:hypothetical protein